MPKCFISPSFQGGLFPKDFLQTKGTLHFVTDWQVLDNDQLVFRVEDDNFVFQLGFKGSQIHFQRNKTISVVSTDDLVKDGRCQLIAMWSPIELTIICGWEDHRKEIRIQTDAIVPPQPLLDWARKNNLLPTIEYNSEEEFRSKVYSCLDSIQDRINDAGCYNSFWNLKYKGNKIESRSPKKETDVHRLVHCVLSDQLLMSSIDIVPEYKTGVGDLDFMFIGGLSGKGLVKMCTEFKNAHSPGLIDGLLYQLPSYMGSKQVQYGAYCILNYKGDWFDEPYEDIADLRDLIDFRLESPYKDRIRVFWLDLSKPRTASKKSS